MKKTHMTELIETLSIPTQELPAPVREFLAERSRCFRRGGDVEQATRSCLMAYAMSGWIHHPYGNHHHLDNCDGCPVGERLSRELSKVQAKIRKAS